MKLVLPLMLAFCLLFCLLFCLPTLAQEKTETGMNKEKIRIDQSTHRIVDSPWALQTVDTTASLRGLHVFSQHNLWASGTSGTIINSFNGGETWRVLIVPGAEKLDFRDLHAIDEATVVAMTSGTPARIYRTTNAGLSWKMVFESTDKRVFLDSISFLDDKTAIVMGDPVDDKFFLLRTKDGGVTWRLLANPPAAQAGEGGFAGSGTNMTTIGKKVLIGLGGGAAKGPVQRSRVLSSDDEMRTWKTTEIPLPRTPTAGVFSLRFANQNDGIAIGGDYRQPDSTENNFALTHDGGRTWSIPAERVPPSGFRSCVAIWLKRGSEVNYVAVGTNGTDRSADLGKTWSRISNHGFHVIQFAPDGQHGWAAGSDGRIAKWLGSR